VGGQSFKSDEFGHVGVSLMQKPAAEFRAGWVKSVGQQKSPGGSL
jgi:hypothetical protein